MDSASFVAARRGIGQGWSFLRGTAGWKLDAFGVALGLVLVQLLLVALAGVRTVAEGVLERGAVHVDIAAGTTGQRTQELYAEVRGLPAVREVTYVTKEQVFADELARDESLAAFLERYGMENPFSDSLVVVPAGADAYGELRAFLQSEDVSAAIDAAAFADLADREASTVRLLEAVGTARIGAELLLFLGIAVAVILAFNLVVRLLAARADVTQASLLSGAPAGVTALPAVTAGVIALLIALAASTLLAFLIVAALVFVPSSAIVGEWMTRAFLSGLLPLAPLVVAIEAAALALLAWIVGRTGTAFRA